MCPYVYACYVVKGSVIVHQLTLHFLVSMLSQIILLSPLSMLIIDEQMVKLPIHVYYKHTWHADICGDPMSPLRPPWGGGVSEAPLHKAYKLCSITNLWECIVAVSLWIACDRLHRVVMTLLQWHKISNLGWDELHRPPMVALSPKITLYSLLALCVKFHTTAM